MRSGAEIIFKGILLTLLLLITHFIRKPGDWETPCDIYISRIKYGE